MTELESLELDLQKYIKEKNPEILVKRTRVALCFPGDPNPNYSSFTFVNWNKLKPWANERGWEVQSPPEEDKNTHPDQKSVLFTRLHLKS